LQANSSGQRLHLPRDALMERYMVVSGDSQRL